MEYEEEDEQQRRRGNRVFNQESGQPQVRKHLTIYSSILKTYENKMSVRNIRDSKFLQPHFCDFRNVASPHNNMSRPADGICSHFLMHGFNRLQKSPVNVGSWSAEARRLVLGTQSGEFTLWEGETFKFERLISTHTPHAVRSMAWSNNGTMLISGDQSGVIKYFNASITFVNAISDAHSNAVKGLSFSHSDSKFASCSDDSTVKIWDWETAVTERTLTEHLSDVKCLEWHPYRSLVVSGSKDGAIKLWDPRQGEAVSTLYSHKNSVLTCGWSGNGHWLATGGRDMLVKVTDIRTMKEMHIFRGHTKEVCSLRWHPIHDSVLLSGSFNGSLIYWMMGHAGPHTILNNAHNYSVNMIAWHPIGHCVATASNDGLVKFWSREAPGSRLEFDPNSGAEWAEQIAIQYGPIPPTTISTTSSMISSSTGTGSIVDGKVSFATNISRSSIGTSSKAQGQQLSHGMPPPSSTFPSSRTSNISSYNSHRAPSADGGYLESSSSGSTGRKRSRFS